eukprot:scpid6096/ scgid30108/ 
MSLFLLVGGLVGCHGSLWLCHDQDEAFVVKTRLHTCTPTCKAYKQQCSEQSVGNGLQENGLLLLMTYNVLITTLAARILSGGRRRGLHFIDACASSCKAGDFF